MSKIDESSEKKGLMKLEPKKIDAPLAAHRVDEIISLNLATKLNAAIADGKLKKDKAALTKSRP